jgi:hypothetical protein
MPDIAEMLDPLFDTHARRVEQAELGLEDEDVDEYAAKTAFQLIFLGGEERSATPSTVHGQSQTHGLPPHLPLIRFSNFSFSHSDISSNLGHRHTRPYIQSAPSSPPQHPQLYSQQSSTSSSSSSSARHTRSCAPTSLTQPGFSTSSSAPRRASTT